ncbi:MAG: hypothetical protein E7449_06455 [Ruminococcaceae bacterium]|nr:hypothetical protein [Oscillospiraceae bacterium]
MKKTLKDRLRVGFGLLGVLLPLVIIGFYVLPHLWGPGAWKPLQPEEYSYVVLDNKVILSGEDADSFIRLLNEQATAKSPLFESFLPEHSILLFDRESGSPRQYYFYSSENSLLSTNGFQPKRSERRLCGEELGAQIETWLSQPQQLPEADQLDSVTIRRRENNTAQLDVSYYEALLSLLARLPQEADPVATPVQLHQSWDYMLVLNREGLPVLTVTQYTYPANTFVHVCFSTPHQMTPNSSYLYSGTVYRFPVSYDLLKELGLE